MLKVHADPDTSEKQAVSSCRHLLFEMFATCVNTAFQTGKTWLGVLAAKCHLLKKLI